MNHSRAVNRSNRISAKKRRRAIRTQISAKSDESRREIQPHDHSQMLQKQAVDRDTLAELLESE